MSYSTSLRLTAVVATVSAAALLAACGSPGGMQAKPMMHSQADVPASVQVPPGNKVAMHTVGVGKVIYECRDKADAAGQTAWTFAGPDAALNDMSGKQIGRYYGPPATWEAMDGSKITGTQVAVAPSNSASLPYQLVKANPATGAGAMSGVTYVQRTNLSGGIAPSSACTPANKGAKQDVKYQADYLFWKAA